MQKKTYSFGVEMGMAIDSTHSGLECFAAPEYCLWRLNGSVARIASRSQQQLEEIRRTRPMRLRVGVVKVKGCLGNQVQLIFVGMVLHGHYRNCHVIVLLCTYSVIIHREQ